MCNMVVLEAMLMPQVSIFLRRSGNSQRTVYQKCDVNVRRLPSLRLFRELLQYDSMFIKGRRHAQERKTKDFGSLRAFVG